MRRLSKERKEGPMVGQRSPAAQVGFVGRPCLKGGKFRGLQILAFLAFAQRVDHNLLTAYVPSPSRCQNDRGPGPLPTPAMPSPFPPPPPPRPCTTTTIPFLFWLGEPTAKPRPHSPPRLTTANWSVVVVAT